MSLIGLYTDYIFYGVMQIYWEIQQKKPTIETAFLRRRELADSCRLAIYEVLAAG